MLILLAIYYFIFPQILHKSLRNLIIFSTSQSLSSSVFILLWIIYFFLVFLQWGHSLKHCLIVIVWFPHPAFLHVGWWSFLVIKCPSVSLVCPIQNLLNWIAHYLQLLWTHSHSSMCGLTLCSLLLIFSQSEFLALLMVK